MVVKLREKRVLVVDDEPALRMLNRGITAHTIQSLGHQPRIVEAASADEAIDRYRGQFFDAVLTDLEMPGSLSGNDVARVFTEAQRPVVMVTSRVDLIDPTLDVGVLEKPFRRATLVELLNDIFSRRLEELINPTPLLYKPGFNEA
jgi:CheY-like chemotaxis protein